MESERQELYERIPWESLEQKSGDRQWLYIGLAGAIALGALAYSFMKNQPVESGEAAQPVPAATPMTVQTPDTLTPSTVASPVVVAEADLFAVDPERLVDAASAHAEWFAVEYFSVDGSEESLATLRSLLPSGVPVPLVPEGTQVFVDWAGTQRISEIAPATYHVDVRVRSLLSTPESGFVRQPTRMLRVEVSVGDDGSPRVTSAPVSLDEPAAAPVQTGLQEVPDDVASRLGEVGQIVGGTPMPTGGWRVVVMQAGPDGVSRPVTVEIP